MILSVKTGSRTKIRLPFIIHEKFGRKDQGVRIQLQWYKKNNELNQNLLGQDAKKRLTSED